MSLKASYTLLAPLYDLVAGPAFRAARRDSLAALPRDGRRTVLVNGVGSGLDLPFDKFLKRGQSAPLRRLLHPLAACLVTRLDVVFEDVLPRVPGLRLVSDEPAAGGGWFRRIRLERV